MPASAAIARRPEAVAALKPDLVLVGKAATTCRRSASWALSLTVMSRSRTRWKTWPTSWNASASWLAARPSPSAGRRALPPARRIAQGQCRQAEAHLLPDLENAADDRRRPADHQRRITLCGGENVFGHLGKMAPTVTVEAVLEADPTIIATGMNDAKPEWLDDWNKWTQMTPSRNNLFHMPGHHAAPHARILDGGNFAPISMSHAAIVRRRKAMPRLPNASSA